MARYIVRNDGPNRYGVDFFSVVDQRTGTARATWTVGHLACEQCDWLNANRADAPDTEVDASALAQEASR